MNSPYQLAQLPTSGLLDHPDLGMCAYKLTEVSSHPERQVEQVIGWMSSYAKEDAGSPLIKEDCRRASMWGDSLDDTWNHIARHGGSRGMQFQRDEITAGPVDLDVWNPVVETLIRPADQAMLGRPMGDCDDFAMYGAAHLLSCGVSCSFVTIAADANAPQMFSHVYLAAYPKAGKYAGMRMAMDLSHGQFLGWEHAEIFRLKEWPIGGICGSSLLAFGAGAFGAYLLYKALGRAN